MKPGQWRSDHNPQLHDRKPESAIGEYMTVSYSPSSDVITVPGTSFGDVGTTWTYSYGPQQHTLAILGNEVIASFAFPGVKKLDIAVISSDEDTVLSVNVDASNPFFAQHNFDIDAPDGFIWDADEATYENGLLVVRGHKDPRPDDSRVIEIK